MRPRVHCGSSDQFGQALPGYLITAHHLYAFESLIVCQYNSSSDREQTMTNIQKSCSEEAPPRADLGSSAQEWNNRTPNSTNWSIIHFLLLAGSKYSKYINIYTEITKC